MRLVCIGAKSTVDLPLCKIPLRLYLRYCAKELGVGSTIFQDKHSMCGRDAGSYRSNQTLTDQFWLSSFAETIADYPATYGTFVLEDSDVDLPLPQNRGARGMYVQYCAS